MDQQPMNGHGPAVDLQAVKAAAAAREELEAQRPALTVQLLRQAGLICACGEALPDPPILYFRVEQGPVQTQQGVQLGVNLAVHACCSRHCPAAEELEATAAARRRGQTGAIVLLGEGRAALAAAQAQ